MTIRKSFLLVMLPLFGLAMGIYAQAPDKPEEMTSFEVEFSKKQTYKVGLRVLLELKYEIQKKKGGEYLWGQSTDFRIYRIRPQLGGDQVEGVSIEHNAYIWIDELTKKSCRIGVFANKVVSELKFDKAPRIMESMRLQEKENEIEERIKKILAIK